MADYTSTTSPYLAAAQAPAGQRTASAATDGEHQAHAGREPQWIADLRRAAVDRAKLGAVRHARNVWELRHRDPLCHHGLALLYTQPEVDTVRARNVPPRQPAPMRTAITSAWRYWLAGPEVEDLPSLLFKLHQEMAPRLLEPGFDVRDWLTFKPDPGMQPDAVYAGIAAVSLDLPDRPWREARPTIRRGEDIASYVRVVLTDGTLVALLRKGYNDFNHVRVQSTHNLAFADGAAPYPLRRMTASEMVPDRDDDSDPFKWLIALGDTCAQADNRRVVGRQPGGRR
ncbi:hypothetical protein [Hamadaea tsunoensis]|uniref:hypothetical protein n=1 Tax=Hamadaea tsunoensis TaxID=53368 RepID=UPI0004297BBC|nr:hypothetical protein [Hamadaea tsunoensis]